MIPNLPSHFWSPINSAEVEEALAVLDSFAHPSTASITGVGIFCNLVVIAVILHYQRDRSAEQRALQGPNSSSSSTSSAPAKRWASAYVHLLFLAFSDLFVDVTCFGAAAWRWELKADTSVPAAFMI